jgi:hypothetical protein
MYLKFVDGIQDEYEVWENIVLFYASTKKEAFEKAKKKGKEDEDLSGTTTLNGRPTHLVFAGVRKLVSFEDPDSGPIDGMEVTYSEFRVRTKEDFEKFIKGKSVSVDYLE